MTYEISIGIPTCNRPNMLVHAIRSCLEQSYLPKEIIIGDDSTDDNSEHLIYELQQYHAARISIKYIKNNPPIGQGLNVNNIIENISCENFLLLHDDDLLEPQALEVYVREFKRHKNVHVVYGKQYIINDYGKISVCKTKKFNQTFMRTQRQELMPLSSINAAVVQQFPNNAFLIRSHCFEKTKYFLPSRSSVVDAAIDFDFGLRLAMANCEFRYVDVYTAMYRMTRNSVSGGANNKAALMAFNIIQTIPENLGLHKGYRDKRLKYFAPVAVMQAVKNMRFDEAQKIFFSKWHRDQIVTFGGFNRMFHFTLYWLIMVFRKRSTD